MRLLITGLGVVSGLGMGREAFARAWREGRTALGWLTVASPVAGQAGLDACEYASEAPEGWDWKADCLTSQTYGDRAAGLALTAVRGAIEDAGWSVPYAARRPVGGAASIGSASAGADGGGSNDAADPLGLVMGTCFGAVASAEAFYKPVAEGRGQAASALVFSHSYPNSPAAMVCIEWGLRGHSAVFAGNRQAGLQALLHAADALSQGEKAGITRLVAGAADALSGAVVADKARGGRYLPATGGEAPTRTAQVPVADAAAWGGVPGEAAIFVVLETEASANRRGARVLAEWNEAEALEIAGQASATAWHIGDCGAATPLLALAAAKWLG